MGICYFRQRLRAPMQIRCVADTPRGLPTKNETKIAEEGGSVKNTNQVLEKRNRGQPHWHSALFSLLFAFGDGSQALRSYFGGDLNFSRSSAIFV